MLDRLDDVRAFTERSITADVRDVIQVNIDRKPSETEVEEVECRATLQDQLAFQERMFVELVDPSGWGLACYHDAPEETDAARERNILAALAGFALENRFREERSYPPRDYLDVLTAVRAEGFADRRALRPKSLGMRPSALPLQRLNPA